MPASVTAIMMKTMKERCFSAQSERLSAAHEVAPRSRTFWPGCSAWTPAVTTTSPGEAPAKSPRVAGSNRCTSTLRSATVRLCGIDDPDRRLAIDRGQRARGNRDARAALELQAPGHRRAEAHRLGVIDEAEPAPGRCA